MDFPERKQVEQHCLASVKFKVILLSLKRNKYPPPKKKQNKTHTHDRRVALSVSSFYLYNDIYCYTDKKGMKGNYVIDV